ncbi:MAG: hypothetical protein HIU92_17850 [Proteobacteria bacterium]|nr:hypothetical protein [Pseudomonadota bacterium]
MPVLDRQNTPPKKAAAKLDYATGFTLGSSAWATTARGSARSCSTPAR